MGDDTTTRTARFVPRLPQPVGVPSLVQIYGADLGKRFPLDAELTVGRSSSNDIVLDNDNVSRRHARFYAEEGSFRVCDLGSTNGTWLHDRPIKGEVVLKHGDIVQIGSVVFKFISGSDAEAHYYEEIYRLAIVDGLTQIHNRRYFTDFLEREVSRCARSGSPLSLVMFDIDSFKTINDTYGHLFGDRVLKEVALLVSRRVRREQLVARYGGDEFVLVLPDTDFERAVGFAEKIRTMVADHPFDSDSFEARITITLGVASLPSAATSAEEFIEQADGALLAAKERGGNLVALAE